jgi:hypothetical protein
VLPAWLLEVLLITLRDLNVTLPGNLAFKSTGHSVNGLPLPADYVATFVIFTPLAFLSDTRAKPVAAMLAWGYVLATALNAINATNPLNKTTTAAQPAASTSSQTSQPINAQGGVGNTQYGPPLPATKGA